MNCSKLFSLISISIILASCATLTQSECQNADWKSIGLDDGSRGRNVTYIQKHSKTCKEYGEKTDVAQYQSGYMAGLARYCTASNGYWLGENGHVFKDVCPVEFGGDYRKGYDKGYRFYRAMDRDRD